MNTLKSLKNNATLRGKSPLAGSIFAGILVGICLLGVVIPHTIYADFVNATNASYVAKASNKARDVVKTIKVVVTAYSSTPDQTDGTPFITASNKYVRDGIIANNIYRLGQKLESLNYTVTKYSLLKTEWQAIKAITILIYGCQKNL